MAKLLFSPVVNEGDAGCLASIEEFGIEVGAPTRSLALYGLRRLLETHCAVLPSRPDICDPKEPRFHLAKAVNKFGFEFMPDPSVLGPAIEGVPHLEYSDKQTLEGTMYRVWVVKTHSTPSAVGACRKLGGKCAFDMIVVADLKIRRSATD